MDRRAIAAGVVTLVVAGALAFWWSDRPGPDPRRDASVGLSGAPAAEREPASPGPSESAGASDRLAPVGPRDDAHAHDADLLPAEDPTGDLGLYERRPMSTVPHRVVRGWGAHGAGQVPGFVGAIVVVAPSIPDERLVQLARDIRAYHGDAKALSVRILDSERAGLYDRHADGGALLAKHLVGRVSRNVELGMDRITIRGEEIEP